MDAIFKGLDVSRFNGEIDWKEVKKAGYSFVIIRIGYGKLSSQKDIMFEKYYSGALAAGLEIGGYWYGYANNTSTAEEEANACLKCIENKKFSYPIYYDVEESDTINSLTNTINTDIVNAFCNRIKNAGFTPGFYTFDSILNKFNLQSIPYEKWLARWSDTMGNNTSDMFSLWQHGILGTSNQATIMGKVPGINGDVDIDLAYKDFTKLTGISFANGINSIINETKKEENNLLISNNKNIKAGMKINLSNTPIYGSAHSSNIVSNKSGIFYIYSNEIMNNRVRITNSETNVGKIPLGTYVTGWIDINDINIINKENNNTILNNLSIGSKVQVFGNLYNSSSSLEVNKKLNGTFYIYSDEIINGRIRITNTLSNVGKTPVSKYTTGWVKITDIN